MSSFLEPEFFRRYDESWLVQLNQLYVGRDSWVMVPLGHVGRGRLALLETLGFDQAPVLGPSGQAIGLVSTQALQSLEQASKALSAESPMISSITIRSACSLDELLQNLETHRAVLVRDGDEHVGLITVSDLNRHAFRTLLYPFLADLELVLAGIVDARFREDPWRWISVLSDDKQVRIVGHWELARKRGVDAGPVTACTLAELLDVVVRIPELMKEFMPLGPAVNARKVVAKVSDLRNMVMHPARPMALGQSDVTRLRSKVSEVCRIGRMVASALSRP